MSVFHCGDQHRQTAAEIWAYSVWVISAEGERWVQFRRKEKTGSSQSYRQAWKEGVSSGGGCDTYMFFLAAGWIEIEDAKPILTSAQIRGLLFNHYYIS